MGIDMKRLITIFHSGTIFKQLVLFTLFVSLLPIIIISCVMYVKIFNLTESVLGRSYSQLVTQYMSNINDTFLKYEDRLEQIANSTIVIDEISGNGTTNNPYSRGTRVSTEINKCLRLEINPEMRSCMVYSNVPEVKIYGNSVSMLEEAEREYWFWNYRTKKEGTSYYYSTKKNTDILSIIKDIIYIDTSTFQKKYLGFIKLDIITDKLFAPIHRESEEFPYEIVISDKKGNLIYCSDKQYKTIFEEVAFESLSNTKMKFWNNKMLYGDMIQFNQLEVIFLFDEDLFMKQREQVKYSIFPILFFVIVFIIIITYLFTKNFSNRVETLINKIKVAETGNLAVMEEIGGNDEITILDRQFNHMLKRLDNLIQKNYIQQLEKKETELKNLQLQINPHFLYNTLETISSMAAVKQAFSICEMCEKLGEIFRYSLGKNYGEYVTVEQEINHIKNYVFILKARFGNKFEVFYDINSNLKTYRIPRFILQPIVENAIVHGFDKKTAIGTLEMTVEKEEERLVISVIDDGVGITLEKVEELNEFINKEERKKETTRSIGIKNVNQRIKLLCGNEYGIIIKSEKGYGSNIIINLPIKQ